MEWERQGIWEQSGIRIDCHVQAQLLCSLFEGEGGGGKWKPKIRNEKESVSLLIINKEFDKARDDTISQPI